jgi:hypothetical protein
MTAFETAHIESRVFGRAVDAETADRLLQEIEDLRAERQQDRDLLNSRWDALVALIQRVNDVHDDLSAYDLGRNSDLTAEQHEKHIEPKRKELREAIEEAKKCN